MKNYTLLSIFAVIIACIGFTGCTKEAAQPNIILILTDDQGYADLSIHGSPDVKTPNMDKLKSQGVSLENFHVSPTCAPTRSAIMTGRYPFRNGITHTILERERMALGITTLPEVLKRGGYTSGIFGKWHLGDQKEYQPESRGFDEVFIHGGGGIGQSYPGSCADAPSNKKDLYFNSAVKHNGVFYKTEGFCTDVFFAQALSWIKEKSDNDEPFFAYIPTNAPHGPFVAPADYKQKYLDENYPDNAAGFFAMIRNIDDNLGTLVKKLDEWDIADNTILIFMTDNGKTGGASNNVHGKTYNAGMKGLKGSIHEGGSRVPFFIRWPKNFKPGKQVDRLLNHFDILPTFADITNIDISDIPNLDGTSFLPLLKDRNSEFADRYRFFHGGRWPLNPNLTSGVEGSERWIGTVDSSNPDSSKYKNYAVRNEQYRFINGNELYDMIKDPGQKQNIAKDNPKVVSQMQEEYSKWWDGVRPYMVNDIAPLALEKPFWVEYNKQKGTTGIKKWEKPVLD